MVADGVEEGKEWTLAFKSIPSIQENTYRSLLDGLAQHLAKEVANR
jgi:hypothetical protein